MIVQALPGFRPDLNARGPTADPTEDHGEEQASSGISRLPGCDGRISIGLLELPRHLRLRWDSLSLQDSGEMEAGAFTDFAGRLLAFLHFKKVDISRPCQVDALSFPGPSSEIVLALGPDEPAGAAGCVIVNTGPSAIRVRPFTGDQGDRVEARDPAGADLELPAGLGIKIAPPDGVPVKMRLVARGAGKVLLLRG